MFDWGKSCKSKEERAHAKVLAIKTLKEIQAPTEVFKNIMPDVAAMLSNEDQQQGHAAISDFFVAATSLSLFMANDQIKHMEDELNDFNIQIDGNTYHIDWISEDGKPISWGIIPILADVDRDWISLFFHLAWHNLHVNPHPSTKTYIPVIKHLISVMYDSRNLKVPLPKDHKIFEIITKLDDKGVCMSYDTQQG